jgi:hypothetical protein
MIVNAGLFENVGVTAPGTTDVTAILEGADIAAQPHGAEPARSTLRDIMLWVAKPASALISRAQRISRHDCKHRAPKVYGEKRGCGGSSFGPQTWCSAPDVR